VSGQGLANQAFAADARKLALLQMTIGGLVAAGFVVWQGAEAGKAAIYGAFISILLARLLSWGVERATRATVDNKKAGAAVLYIGAAGRFALALILFAVGIASLKLMPVPILVGFGCAQAAFFIFNHTQQVRK
jgi:F0F1-type ATP synthase assembly protein I